MVCIYKWYREIRSIRGLDHTEVYAFNMLTKGLALDANIERHYQE